MYEATKTWFDVLQVKKCRDIVIPITEAYNRVLAEDVIAKDDLPKFDRSAADGFAVRAEDTKGASQSKPLLFRFAEGDKLADPAHREAKQVQMGTPIPKGADAVVILENTQKKNTKLEVLTQVAISDNIICRGADLKKGEVAAKSGTRLNPYYIALLSALDCSEVKVVEKPKIAILAAGKELKETDKVSNEKQSYESNRSLLVAMCYELDAEPLDLGTVMGDVAEIAESIELGLKIADAVITIGGIKVDEIDLIPEAINKLGKPGIIVRGIAMQPAMHTALAAIDHKPIMIFSSSPVAAITGFEVFARPLICKLLGMKQEEKRPTVKAVLTRRVTTMKGKKNFVQVHVFQKNDELYAEPIITHSTTSISNIAKANGYVIVPENREGLMEGITVTVNLLAK